MWIGETSESRSARKRRREHTKTYVTEECASATNYREVYTINIASPMLTGVRILYLSSVLPPTKFFMLMSFYYNVLITFWQAN